MKSNRGRRGAAAAVSGRPDCTAFQHFDTYLVRLHHERAAHRLPRRCPSSRTVCTHTRQRIQELRLKCRICAAAAAIFSRRHERPRQIGKGAAPPDEVTAVGALVRAMVSPSATAAG